MNDSKDVPGFVDFDPFDLGAGPSNSSQRSLFPEGGLGRPVIPMRQSFETHLRAPGRPTLRPGPTVMASLGIFSFDFGCLSKKAAKAPRGFSSDELFLVRIRPSNPPMPVDFGSLSSSEFDLCGRSYDLLLPIPRAAGSSDDTINLRTCVFEATMSHFRQTCYDAGLQANQKRPRSASSPLKQCTRIGSRRLREINIFTTRCSI